jgi:hypothetical protein
VIRGSYRAGLVPSASNRRNERLRIALVFTMVLFAGGNVLVGRVLAKPKARPKAKAATFADVQAECSAPVELVQIQDRLFTL